MKPLCSLNGRILPVDEARIDPRDRGFVYGDALYEAVKVAHGTILHFEPHLERLRASLERAEIPCPRNLRQDCLEVVEAAGLREGSLYIQVSRGVAARTHIPPTGLTPTVLVMPASHGFSPPAGRPMKLISVSDWRWRFCDVKTTSLMATVMGKLEVRSAGADEVLFVDANGRLRECGSTNIFVRQRDRLFTHPLDGSILSGVTRTLVLERAAEEGLEVVEEAPVMAQRSEWQEVFVTGTLTGVQPIVELDGEPVAAGQAGPWTHLLAARHEAYEIAAAGGSPRPS